MLGHNSGTVTAIRRDSGTKAFVVPDLLNASAIAFDDVSNTLFVADIHRTRNNIRVLDASNGATVGAFGEPGGIFGAGNPSGTFGPTRFYGVNAVGTDQSGCFVVNNAHGGLGGTDLRRFCPPLAGASENVGVTKRPSTPQEWVSVLPTYELLWQRENHYWQEVGDLSRVDEDVVYMNEMKFRINWSQPVNTVSVAENNRSLILPLLVDVATLSFLQNNCLYTNTELCVERISATTLCAKFFSYKH